MPFNEPASREAKERQKAGTGRPLSVLFSPALLAALAPGSALAQTTRSLAYLSRFTEHSANDGRVHGTIVIVLTGDTFTEDVIDLRGGGYWVQGNHHVHATNVPAGLTATFSRSGDRRLTMSLTGHANNHANDDDVSNLTVTFDNEAFTGGNAATVANSTKSNLTIDFNDPPAPTRSLPEMGDPDPMSLPEMGDPGTEVVPTIPVQRVETTTNAAPIFSSPATFNVAENTTSVGTVMAMDADVTDSVTSYSVTGGEDMALFSITNAGVLSFNSAPDYEAPMDQGTNNNYQVTVTATSGTGLRAMSATQDITVTVADVDEPPVAPGPTTFTNVTSTAFTVNWTEPENTGTAITHYNVRYREEGSGEFIDANYDGTGTSHIVTNLTPATNYEVQVRAGNDEGEGGWSAPSAVTTDTEAVTETDPLTRVDAVAWLARFGRTVTDQVLDAVDARMDTGTGAPAHVTLAGESIGLDMVLAGIQLSDGTGQQIAGLDTPPPR